jgi:ferredoxin
MARVAVDWDKCICSGMCLAAAPSVFDIADGAQMVLVHGSELSAGEVGAVEDAIACCPAEALAIEP